MKKYKIVPVIVFYLLFLTSLKGQDIKKGDHIRDKRINNFEGSWQGSSGDTVLQLVLEKNQYHNEQSDLTYDLIIGWYSLEIDRKIIYSYTKESWNKDIKNVILQGHATNENKLLLYINRPENIYSRYQYIMTLKNQKNAILTLEYANSPLNSQRKQGIKLPIIIELRKTR